jgi:hypothetical protein
MTSAETNPKHLTADAAPSKRSLRVASRLGIGGKHTRVIFALAAVLIALGVVGANSLDAAPLANSASAAHSPSASVAFTDVGHPIPRGFFGLSIEYNELARYQRYGTLFGHIIALVRPRDGGPMSLWIEGKSADHAIWEPPSPSPPPGNPIYAVPPASSTPGPALPKAKGVFAIDQTWLVNLAALVRAENLRVILDLNLAVHSPGLEASFAQAAERALPSGSLRAFEIGNEPNEYHYQPPLQNERIASTSRDVPLGWWRAYTPADYRRDYLSYARALTATVPGVPLGAPDLSSANPEWMAAVTGLGRLDPSFLAIHRYATSTCFSPTSPWYPSIPLLLNDQLTAGPAGSVPSAVVFAHTHRMALRLTEVNSVSCGGHPGIANSFATALWAANSLLQMIAAGVTSVSWHIRPQLLNAPFHISDDRLQAMPELYGLALFARMTHGAATLVGGTVTGASQSALTAWAVRKGHAENVLLINRGARSAAVSVPGYRADSVAVVQRLTAPSVSASTGVRFAGMEIGPDGAWQGVHVQSRVVAAGGVYRVRVAGYSAALVTPERR